VDKFFSVFFTFLCLLAEPCIDNHYLFVTVRYTCIQYDKQDEQGKAAFNERNPLTTQEQEPLARSP
jgi:hypothetical protein